MNFVELVNSAILEAEVSGSSVTTLQGTLPLETARLKKWMADSWMELQQKPRYWAFHFVESSFPNIPLNATVIQPPEFAAKEVAEWGRRFLLAEPGKSRKDAQPLTQYDYFWWRDQMRDMTVARRPDSITVDWSTETLIISPPSDQVGRTLYYDYWRTPQRLVQDTDVPLMPDRFHEILVGLTLQKYGIHESAPEAIAKGNTIVSRHNSALHSDQGRKWQFRGLVEC